jgi:hypothetical protein
MNKFTGMWRLDKYEAFDSASNKWHDAPNRIGYSGYILYDGIGQMAVQLFPPGFKDVNTNKTLDSLNNIELRKILKLYSTSFAYFANCDISDDKNSIEHHIVSSNNPEDCGTTVKRDFEFRGDTLILTAKELIGGFKVRLLWIRL